MSWLRQDPRKSLGLKQGDFNSPSFSQDGKPSPVDYCWRSLLTRVQGGDGCTAMKFPPEIANFQVGVVEWADLSRPMQIWNWPCRGRLNIGKTPPLSRLHSRRAQQRDNGDCPPAFPLKSNNLVFLCMSLAPLTLRSLCQSSGWVPASKWICVLVL